MAETTTSVFFPDIGVIKAIDFRYEVGSDKRQGFESAEFVKQVDSTSPALFKARTNKQMFRQVIATFRRPKSDGSAGREMFFRLRLMQASISVIKYWSPDSINPAESPLPEYERIEITCLHAIPEYEGAN